MGIVEQALAKLPVGPVWIDDPRFVLPEKDKVYNSIEGLMHHFKIIMGIHCRRAKPISPWKAATESSVSILWAISVTIASEYAALFYRHGRLS